MLYVNDKGLDVLLKEHGFFYEFDFVFWYNHNDIIVLNGYFLYFVMGD